MSMWPPYFGSLDVTGLSLGYEHGCENRLTESPGGRTLRNCDKLLFRAR
jgi:hypothetical protein